MATLLNKEMHITEVTIETPWGQLNVPMEEKVTDHAVAEVKATSIFMKYLKDKNFPVIGARWSL